MSIIVFYRVENGGIEKIIKLLARSGAEILRAQFGQLALNWPNWVRNISAPERASNLIIFSIPPFSTL